MGGREAAGRDAGGIRSLRRFLAEHSEALDADFQRFYRIHLARDLGTPRLTYGRFLRLTRGLPAESNYAQDIAGPKGWSLTEQLLAAATNELRQFRFMYAKANFKPPHQKPTFITPPDPHAADKAAERLSLEAMRERLNDPRWVDVDAEPTRI